MTVRDALLPVLDFARGIRGILGFADVAVTMRTVAFSGGRVGLGTKTVTDTPLLVGIGEQNPRVTQLTARDALLSGGVYTSRDVKLGPLTPAFPASPAFAAAGVDATTINPPMVNGAPVEVYFKLTGGGLTPTVGVWFKRIGDQVVSATRYYLILREAGVQNPGGQP